MMTSRIKALRIQFKIIDFLSNFRCFHKHVLHKKIYLGAAIISLNMISSSCTSEPNKNKGSISEKPTEENIDDQISCYDTIAPSHGSNHENAGYDKTRPKKRQ